MSEIIDVSLDELVPKEIKTESDKRIFFNQWKLYVEMADKIGQRRGNTNNFFLSINALLLTALIVLLEQHLILGLLPLLILGLVLSLIWRNLIVYYGSLSRVKFRIINKLEEMLPARGYIVEWQKLKQGRDPKEFWSSSKLEIIAPISLVIFYFISIVGLVANFLIIMYTAS